MINQFGCIGMHGLDDTFSANVSKVSQVTDAVFFLSEPCSHMLGIPAVHVANMYAGDYSSLLSPAFLNEKRTRQKLLQVIMFISSKWGHLHEL